LKSWSRVSVVANWTVVPGTVANLRPRLLWRGVGESWPWLNGVRKSEIAVLARRVGSRDFENWGNMGFLF
jgi:hypothetical protein